MLVILGFCIACVLCLAPSVEAQPAPELQTESPFAEEIKQLDSAPDKTARQAAFSAVLTKAKDLKRDPEPLLSILRNKRPEESFRDLTDYIRDNEPARHKAFISVLIINANDAGDPARVAADAVALYEREAVPVIIEMLASETGTERLAAASIARKRVGGAWGVVRVIRPLVNALERDEADLNGVAMKSLRTLALLELETAAEWREWLGKKTDVDLLVEIADRETKLRKHAEAEKARIQAELLSVLLERMRTQERKDAPALIARLKASEHLIVRREAVALLRELVTGATDEVARPIIDALGESLNNRAESEEVRKDCAAALADSGRPALSFPHLDRALEGNSLGADLRLELVKGLNAPVAAARVARMLQAEIDQAETRSSAVLEALISQVRSVLEVEDSSPHKDEILAQFSRLLQLVAAKVGGELEAPARKRYVDLAVKTCDTLVHIARLRRVDILGCVDALIALALTDNGASSASVTAIRQALNVPAARPTVLQKLTETSVAERLKLVFAKLVSGSEEAMLINLLGLYEDMVVAPEPVENLRKRLLDRASSTEAVLSANPDTRKTLRDALRGLLSKLLNSPDEHATLVKDLLACEYGGNDALGYLLLLKPSRTEIVTAAMQPYVERQPIRVELLVVRLDQSLNSDERANRDYVVFRAGLAKAVRARVTEKIGKGLQDGVDDALKQELTGLASGPMRDHFVLAAVAELRRKPDAGDARDTVSEILLSTLRSAHPERYDAVVLKGLTDEAFTKALDDLNDRLRNDGYTVP